MVVFYSQIEYRRTAMSPLNRLRADFNSGDSETLLILGLANTVIGGLTASGASDVGIGPAFGTVLLIVGIVLIGGTIVWGSSEQVKDR